MLMFLRYCRSFDRVPNGAAGLGGVGSPIFYKFKSGIFRVTRASEAALDALGNEAQP